MVRTAGRQGPGYSEAASVPSNPAVLWEPSQKGLLDERPHRHKKLGLPSRSVTVVPSWP